jgi:hypothetical protein
VPVYQKRKKIAIRFRYFHRTVLFLGNSAFSPVTMTGSYSSAPSACVVVLVLMADTVSLVN